MDIEAFNDVLNLMSEQSDEFDSNTPPPCGLRSGDEEAPRDPRVDRRQDHTADGRRHDPGDRGRAEGEGEADDEVAAEPLEDPHVDREPVLYDEDGRRLALPADVAERAVAITYALFVAPKAEPKTDGLKLLGVSKDDVCDEETIGSKVQVTGG